MGSTEKSRCTSIIKDVNKPNLIAQHLFITKKRKTMNINHYLKPSDVDGTGNLGSFQMAPYQTHKDIVERGLQVIDLALFVVIDSRARERNSKDKPMNFRL